MLEHEIKPFPVPNTYTRVLDYTCNTRLVIVKLDYGMGVWFKWFGLQMYFANGNYVGFKIRLGIIHFQLTNQLSARLPRILIKPLSALDIIKYYYRKQFEPPRYPFRNT